MDGNTRDGGRVGRGGKEAEGRGGSTAYKRTLDINSLDAV